ncbi:MAG: c-type cytochrome [Anaerolineae bacterium]
MNNAFVRVVIFTLVIVLIFVWIGQVLTDISGGGVTVVAAEGVNPEAGEAIYWGKGKCSTCHSVGSRGSAIRGANHENVAITAQERAAELGLSSATEYLVQSIADPSAYVVEGYKDEMPLVYRPPIALKPDEIRAVITYLQSLGGEVDVAAIQLPDVILQAATAGAGEEPFRPYLEGDPAAGEALFFDEASDVACGKCHTFDGRGGEVGPELTEVAGTRTLPYIIESILTPSAEIASGYEPVLLRTTAGKTINGVLRAEDETSLTIVTKEGEEIVVQKSDVARRAEDPPSLMPDNFAEILSVVQLHDILAFLQTGAQE